MSENPNPTRCGQCGTENPPGQEYCVNCGASLTLAAGSDALAETPEAVDELRELESPATPSSPPETSLGRMSGDLMPTPDDHPESPSDLPPRS